MGDSNNSQDLVTNIASVYLNIITRQMTSIDQPAVSAQMMQPKPSHTEAAAVFVDLPIHIVFDTTPINSIYYYNRRTNSLRTDGFSVWRISTGRVDFLVWKKKKKLFCAFWPFLPKRGVTPNIP